jgi:hypothetical protein
MHHLALEVGGLDHVVVDHRDGAHPGGRERQHGRRSEAAGADHGDVGGGEAALCGLAEAGQCAVACGAGALGVRQFGNRLHKRGKSHAHRLRRARGAGASGETCPRAGWAARRGRDARGFPGSTERPGRIQPALGHVSRRGPLLRGRTGTLRRNREVARAEKPADSCRNCGW